MRRQHAYRQYLDLLGNGDGTFKAPKVLAPALLDTTYAGLQAVDFNGNGNTSLVAFVSTQTEMCSTIARSLFFVMATEPFKRPSRLPRLASARRSRGFNGDALRTPSMSFPTLRQHYSLYAVLGKGNGLFQNRYRFPEPLCREAPSRFSSATSMETEARHFLHRTGRRLLPGRQRRWNVCRARQGIHGAGPEFKLFYGDFNGDGKLDVASKCPTATRMTSRCC